MTLKTAVHTCFDSCTSASSWSFDSFTASTGAVVKPQVNSRTSAIIEVSGTIIATGLKRDLRLSGSSTRPEYLHKKGRAVYYNAICSSSHTNATMNRSDFTTGQTILLHTLDSW